MSQNLNRSRIAFLTSGDPNDRRSWSGIDYYMANALRRHCGEVCHIGHITPKFRLLAGKIVNKASITLLRRRYAYLQSFFLAKGYARILNRRLAREQFDLLFVPSAAPVAAFLETDVPMVYLSGTTFALMQSYYPQYSDLLPLSVREGNAIEQMAIDRASKLLYPTEWPARSAVEHYGADESKIRIIPYGANLEEKEIPPEEAVLGKKRGDVCRLLFLGVDWERKGGPIAVETLRELEKMGVRAELTVCGCAPPSRFNHPWMRAVPFLDKNDPTQRRRLNDLFMNSDFLLLPTRSECFGVVFCEASAFGLPSVTTDTGGVPGVVRHGENGFLLAPDAGGREYAQAIAAAFENETAYRDLVASSRTAFWERLNWDAWGSAVRDVICPTKTAVL